MGLSQDLISQFAKITNDSKATKKETVLYGTIKELNGTTYVKLDGSDMLTPYESVTEVKDGERVAVTIKNHTLTATGNMSSPAARGESVSDLSSTVKKIQADSITTENLSAINAKIEKLEADIITTENLEAVNAKIEQLEADIITTEELDANYVNTEELNAVNATIQKLNTDKANIKDLEAQYASIDFANIDFANISKAVFKEFYANSGIIKDVVVDNQQITGLLVGVTVKGDLIEGNTIVADKLVIKGTDGLYYKLNTDGMKIEAEQTDYNSLNGSIITAKSITATKIAVEDLVAFDATIGGFKITENAIYSGVKESADNDTRGVYLDSEGQFVVGDGSNYLKYYKDGDGNYILAFACEGVATTDDIEQTADDIHKIINEQNTSIMSDCSNIISKAFASYTETKDFEAFKTTVESQIQQKVDEVTITLTSTITQLESSNEDMSDRLQKYEKHFTFTENGIGIKDACGNNSAELRLDTGIISFRKNNKQYGWWDGVDFHTGNIIVKVNERAQFGNFAYVPRTDGSMSVLLVSGDGVIDNKFSFNIVSMEPNVTQIAQTSDTSAIVTVSSMENSALYFPLNMTKTYRLRYTGDNVIFSAVDASYNNEQSCVTSNCDMTFTGKSYGYFYIKSMDTTNTYTLNNVILEEVTE